MLWFEVDLSEERGDGRSDDEGKRQRGKDATRRD